MGQYYIGVNTKRRERIHPHAFGDGLKLREFCGSSHGFLMGLAMLLRNDDFTDYLKGENLDSITAEACRVRVGPSTTYAGRWAGDPIEVVGDYSKDGLYGIAMDEYEDISMRVVEHMAEDSRTKDLMHEKIRWRFAIPTMCEEDELVAYGRIFGSLRGEE